MTESEYRAHFSLWAMLAAPLMAGNDLANMDAATKAILLNREIIAIDQDTLGRQASRVQKNGDAEVWSRPLADGGRAVLLFNRGKEPANIAIEWPTLGYPATLSVTVRDVWAAKNLPRTKGRIGANVKPHDVVVYRIGP
jgi:alpha-galactosidase